MANPSEKTFGQRLEKARAALEIIKNIPAYAPNSLITLANFGPFLDTVEASNNSVATKQGALSDTREDRRDAYFGKDGLKDRAAQARDHVGGLGGGKKSASYKRFQKLAQKLGTYRPPKKPLTGETGAGAPAKDRISQSEKSYGSMAQFGRDLATHAAGTTGYAPTNTKITAAALDTLADQLKAKNADVAKKLSETEDAQNTRSDLYYADKTGLLDRVRAIKSYVAGEFGRDSTEYKQLVALKI